MPLIRLLTILSLVLFTSLALAHNDLKSTTPKDGAALSETPEKLVLTFGGQVRLADVSLTNKAGEPQSLEFKRSTEAKETFAYPLSTLKPGQYEVNWTALGSDGHKLEGQFGFKIEPE